MAANHVNGDDHEGVHGIHCSVYAKEEVRYKAQSLSFEETMAARRERLRTCEKSQEGRMNHRSRPGDIINAMHIEKSRGRHEACKIVWSVY